jgi:hypothetical protein
MKAKLDEKKYPALAGAFKNLTIAENEGRLNELTKEAKGLEDKHEKDLTPEDKKRLEELGKEIEVEQKKSKGSEEEPFEEASEEDQPDEDDLFIQDSGPLGSQYSVGTQHKHIGTYADSEEMEKAIKEWMDANKFWPNIWYISDHGNVSPYKMEPEDEMDMTDSGLTAQVTATGEPDQEYDHATYDAVVNALRENGYEADHSEFDKYQGVYLDVGRDGKRIDKFWTVDSHVQGVPKQKPEQKYRSAVLIDAEGNESSATRGDYFQMGDEDVFDGAILVLKGMNGEESTIENPKKSDLPDMLEVQNGIEYEGEPSVILHLVAESQGEEAEPMQVEVSPEGKADITELLDFLKMESKLE